MSNSSCSSHINVLSDKVLKWDASADSSTPKNQKLTCFTTPHSTTNRGSTGKSANGLSSTSPSSGRFTRQHNELFDKMKSIYEVEELRKERSTALSSCLSERIARLAQPKDSITSHYSNKNHTPSSYATPPTPRQSPITSPMTNRTNSASRMQNTSGSERSRPLISRFSMTPTTGGSGNYWDRLSTPRRRLTSVRNFPQADRNTPVCVPRRNPPIDVTAVSADKN